jgi:hypothetical protein
MKDTPAQVSLPFAGEEIGVVRAICESMQLQPIQPGLRTKEVLYSGVDEYDDNHDSNEDMDRRLLRLHTSVADCALPPTPTASVYLAVYNSISVGTANSGSSNVTFL